MQSKDIFPLLLRGQQRKHTQYLWDEPSAWL